MEKVKHDPDVRKLVHVRMENGGLLSFEVYASPHACDVPNCPGDRNRRKLGMFDRYKKALEGLTPGGSEFVDDPERCGTFVREARESQARGMQMWAKRAKVNEAKLEMWDEMLEALEESKTIIKIFHGQPTWDIYATQSPEMKRISRVIAKAKELK